MIIWDILNVKQTHRNELIRDAFVRAFCSVKHEYFTREGFLILFEAYHRAIMIANNIEKDAELSESQDSAFIIDPTTQAYLDQVFAIRNSVYSQAPTSSVSKEILLRVDDIVAFLAGMMALHHDFYSRINITNWKTLLQTDLLCYPKIVSFLRLPVLSCIATNPVMPQDIFIFLDLVFHWTESSYSIPQSMATEKQIVSIETDPRWRVDFSAFEAPKIRTRAPRPYASHMPNVFRAAPNIDSEQVIDFERYASHRHNARMAIINGDEVRAEEEFMLAYQIYDHDPDIFVIYFEYLNSIKDHNKKTFMCDIHLLILDRLLTFYPNNFSFRLARIEMQSLSQSIDESVKSYKSLLSEYPDSLIILYHIAKIYERHNQESNARKYFRQIEKSYASTQAKLKSGRGFSTDSAVVSEHIRLNDEVNQLIAQSSEPSGKFFSLSRKA